MGKIAIKTITRVLALYYVFLDFLGVARSYNLDKREIDRLDCAFEHTDAHAMSWRS